MAEKIVLLEKMSKRQRKEHLKKNRIMFGHQQCPVVHKSAKELNRKRENKKLAALKREYNGEFFIFHLTYYLAYYLATLLLYTKSFCSYFE